MNIDFIPQNAITVVIASKGYPGAFKKGIIESKKEREIYRKIADDIFLEGMESAEPPVSKWKIKSAYYAVRMFGRWAINSSAPRG